MHWTLNGQFSFEIIVIIFLGNLNWNQNTNSLKFERFSVLNQDTKLFTILCYMKQLCSWDFPCESCRAIQFPNCRRELKLVERIKHSKVASRMWGRHHRIRPGSVSWPSGSVLRLSSYFPRSWPELVSRPCLKIKYYFSNYMRNLFPVVPGHAIKIRDKVTWAIPCWAALTEFP